MVNCLALAIRLRWLSITPFGFPEVPPVYTIAASVSSSNSGTRPPGLAADRPRRSRPLARAPSRYKPAGATMVRDPSARDRPRGGHRRQAARRNRKSSTMNASSGGPKRRLRSLITRPWAGRPSQASIWLPELCSSTATRSPLATPSCSRPVARPERRSCTSPQVRRTGPSTIASRSASIRAAPRSGQSHSCVHPPSPPCCRHASRIALPRLSRPPRSSPLRCRPPRIP